MNAVSVTTMTALYAGGFNAWSVRNFPLRASGTLSRIPDHLLRFRRDNAFDAACRNYPAECQRDCETDHLRFAMCGSAPVPAEVLKRLKRHSTVWWSRAMACPNQPAARPSIRLTRRRPGSCGKPIGNEMRVVDEKDVECPTANLARSSCAGEYFQRLFPRSLRHCQRVRRRLVSHWRHWLPRCGWFLLHRRPQERHDHSRR